MRVWRPTRDCKCRLQAVRFEELAKSILKKSYKPGSLFRNKADLPGPTSASDETEPPEAEEPEIQDIVKLIHKNLETDFSQYKTSMLKRRLLRRMYATNNVTLSEYYKTLKKDSKELYQLSQELLINVTSFFRDKEAFTAVKEYIRRIVLDKKEHDEIRLWSAGCATGEEAYSLAILISEVLDEEKRFNPYRVFASDLDHHAIAYARHGLYTASELKGVAKGTLKKFFTEKRGAFEVKKKIRDAVIFARQDIIQNPPFVKMDLISCRNVLIYFENDLQKKVFDIFHYALKPAGYLFLGKSENLVGAANLFEVQDRKGRIFLRKNTAKRMPALMGNTKIPDYASLNRRSLLSDNLMAKAQFQLLHQLGVGGALVDEVGNIYMTIGPMSEFFNISPGARNFNLIHLLPQSAGQELESILRKAGYDRASMRGRVIEWTPRNRERSLSLRVSNFGEEYGKKLFLVSMEPVSGKSST